MSFIHKKIKNKGEPNQGFQQNSVTSEWKLTRFELTKTEQPL